MNPTFTLDLLGYTIPDTVVVTLLISVGLVGISVLSSRFLKPHGVGLWQTCIEGFAGWIENTVSEVVEEDPRPYVPLIGTLMLFIALSNILSVVPILRPPTAELSTAIALSLVVFVAVPVYGVRRHGLVGYLKIYAQPSPVLLPLNILGELTRTLALCIRLFGNVMSGQMVGAIMLLLAGLLVPVPLLLLGLLTGLIQAYIFGILAAVYIAAAVRVEQRHTPHEESP